MINNKFTRFVICFFAYILFFAIPLKGQTIEILETLEDSTGVKSYALKIDGQIYIALSDAKTREKEKKLATLKIELDAANKRIDADSSMMATLDHTVAVYNRNIALKDSLIGEIEDLYIGYKDLYFDYKKVYSDPWLYLHGGVGAAFERGGDEDIKPAILLGLSIKRLSFLGYINNDQSGFLLGINYPVRFNFWFF